MCRQLVSDPDRVLRCSDFYFRCSVNLKVTRYILVVASSCVVFVFVLLWEETTGGMFLPPKGAAGCQMHRYICCFGARNLCFFELYMCCDVSVSDAFLTFWYACAYARVCRHPRAISDKDKDKDLFLCQVSSMLSFFNVGLVLLENSPKRKPF